jgi:hypothetical protein
MSLICFGDVVYRRVNNVDSIVENVFELVVVCVFDWIMERRSFLIAVSSGKEGEVSLGLVEEDEEGFIIIKCFF